MSVAPTIELDVARARSRFSALRREIGGQTARFFDGAGGSQVPDGVIEAISGYLRRSNANEGGAFVTSAETNHVLEAAHATAADLLGASPAEIAFGANMTTLNFLLTHAFGRTLEPGDEIVTTQLDHEGNVSPWRLLAEDRELIIHSVPVRGDGALAIDELEGLLSSRTRAVAFPLASNAIGTIPDAARIVEAAHRVGALAWADGVHAAPHLALRFGELDLDVLLCSPYKFFGPHLGIAAIREQLARTWPADRVAPAAQHPPGHRFETGTLSHEALAGLAAAVEYIAELTEHEGTRRERLLAAYSAIGRYERTLSLRFLEGAARVAGLRVYGNIDAVKVSERTPTFLVTLAGQPPQETARALGERGFFVWHGDFYAPGPVRAVGLGTEGGVRLSFLHYNTIEEVDDLLAALGEFGS